ncbi:hypothetical protein AMAG_01171 [Allomyces macrogynus ATCC 38327]|uniref:sphingomyelin phosphodiesterase n=1 Tax=Allomyces macrogynus (strain ATCC 38327) TaxID=578462 RepID=A0A0L0RY22_ALLM3|nr:hypothetical protein AMAG_01171 [Allomyces macrogynus ATCC 38327]|eukprot:KNE55258.1 hypothetical protein AMAG_01171 [Allomyces macrogynus ATCC 38327]
MECCRRPRSPRSATTKTYAPPLYVPSDLVAPAKTPTKRSLATDPDPNTSSDDSSTHSAPPPAHHAHAKGPAPASAHPAVLRLMTYNFFLRPPLIADYKGDSKEERLEEFIHRVLPRYDILALQETFSGYSSRVARLEKAAVRQGYLGHVRGPQGTVLHGHLLDAGLLVLSRWPIIESSNWTYSRGVTVDRLAAKGVSYTHHVHPDCENVHLHLFNTHLQASYSTAPDPHQNPSVACRDDQVRELAEFIHHHVSKHVLATVPADAVATAASKDVAMPSRPSSPRLHDVPPPASSDSNDAASATRDKLHHLILVCGDLNVNSLQSNQTEYQRLLDMLKGPQQQFAVADLLAQHGSVDYTQIPWRWLSQKRRDLSRDIFEQEGGRLDYILSLSPAEKAISAAGGPWNVHNVVIDKCEAEHPSFLQLSDHMGVAATLAWPGSSAVMEAAQGKDEAMHSAE